nr:mitochondrial import inner membrane translocase subunit Tim17-B isoform X2 [Oryctolagus cuniculus]
MEEYAREPCPWRIVDDCGGAFTMGVIGGGVFQAIKGFRNAPVGMRHRLRGSINAVRIRAPQIGAFLTCCLLPETKSRVPAPCCDYEEHSCSVKSHLDDESAAVALPCGGAYSPPSTVAWSGCGAKRTPGTPSPAAH